MGGNSLSYYKIASHPTGSAYICDPPVVDTDVDTVMLLKPEFEGALKSEGFYTNQSTNIEYESLGNFSSWRRGNENIIATSDEEFYKRFVLATEEAKLRNLRNKTDRITLFQEILYR